MAPSVDWVEVGLLLYISAFLLLKALLLRRGSALGRWLAAANVAVAAAYLYGAASRVWPDVREVGWLVWANRALVATTATGAVVALLRAARGWRGIRAALGAAGPGDDRA